MNFVSLNDNSNTLLYGIVFLFWINSLDGFLNKEVIKSDHTMLFHELKYQQEATWELRLLLTQLEPGVVKLAKSHQSQGSHVPTNTDT